jgi:hypothetical protein
MRKHFEGCAHPEPRKHAQKQNNLFCGALTALLLMEHREKTRAFPSCDFPGPLREISGKSLSSGGANFLPVNIRKIDISHCTTQKDRIIVAEENENYSLCCCKMKMILQTSDSDFSLIVGQCR